MAVTRIEEGGLGTDSFNLPVTLNGTDGSSTHAGDNIVLDASASGVDAGERLLYEGIPPDSIDISNSISVLSGATLTVAAGATIVNSGTATGFGSNEPTSADGQALGSTSAEWSDLYLADGGVIYFGNDQEVKLTHSADSGIILKHTATADDKPINLVLQTGETDMAANDVIGKISFQAPDEGTGTDAILVSAAIAAIAEGDHSSSSNATKLSFMTGASEAAAEKMSLSSAGLLTVTGGIANNVVDSITAGTTQSQAGATALTGTFNRVTVSGTNGDGVKLPAASAGLEVTIDNADSAQTIDVWPATGNKIEGGSDNAVDPTSIQFGTSRTYFCVDGDTWRRNIPAGTVLQREVFSSTGINNNATTDEAATGLTDTISLLDAGSAVRIYTQGAGGAHRSAGSPTNLEGILKLWRTAVTSGTEITSIQYGKRDANPVNADSLEVLITFVAEDSPATKAATTYVVGITSISTDVLAQWNGRNGPAFMILEEIAT